MSVQVSANLKSSSVKSWGNLSDLNLQIFVFSQWDIWALRTICCGGESGVSSLLDSFLNSL